MPCFHDFYDPPRHPNETKEEYNFRRDRAYETKRRLEKRLRAFNHPDPEDTDTTKILVQLMRELLQSNPSAPDENNTNPELDALRHQANALNLAFQRLLQDADTLYQYDSNKVIYDPVKYAAAFKAQDQYRRTVKALHDIKMAQIRTEKVNKIRGKRP